jgi:hypothetical protein
MIEVKSIAAQGDVLFRRIGALPTGVIEQPRRGRLVVAHSETGHHHAIDDLGARLFERQQPDPLICYLSVDGDFADIVHHRAHDTHQTLRLMCGVWEVRRQREWAREQPSGEMVED